MKRHRTTTALAWCVAFALGVALGCSPAVEPRPASESGAEPRPHSTPVEAEAAARYVGAKACVGCHSDVAATYRHTGMGRAFYPMTSETAVEEFAESSEIVIPGTELRYRMIERDGRYYQRQFVLASSGEELVPDEREITWVMGSGKHARSYVTRVGDALFQMPICWYPDPEIWDLCPGYELGNEHFSREIVPTCVFCHNGRMVPVGTKANVYEEPIPHGIGCERCHGPGERHAAFWSDSEAPPSGGGDTIVNPRSLPREERMQVCFQCHFGDSLTSERVHHRDRDLLDFRPGMAITDVMVPFSLRTVPRLEFGLSAQVDRLVRSRCYRESEGRLECLTCHDPHVSVYSEDRPVDLFTRRCLECHDLETCTASSESRATTDPPDDCVACHMRTAEADDQRHATYTDHWIRKEIDAAGEETLADEPAPIFPEHFAGLTPAEQAFYRARADMLIAVDLPPAVRPPMWENAEAGFRQAIREGLDDARAWVFLGMVQDSRGRLSEAEEAFERAHAADSSSREEAFNLGTFKLRRGKVQEAEAIFRKLLAQDPDDVGALAELGRCALASGQNEEALALYDRAIPLSPTLASLRTNRGAALAKMGRFEEAARAVEEAARLSPDDPDLWVFWGELLKRTDRPAEATEAALIAKRLQQAAAASAGGPKMGM